MDEQDPAVADLVKKMKATAWKHARVPIEVAPRQCYHYFANGLSLCLTIDIISEGYARMMAEMVGEFPEKVITGWFWHLSITRVGTNPPMPAEVEFWRRAFFEEKPDIERPGELPGVNASHFFWVVK